MRQNHENTHAFAQAIHKEVLELKVMLENLVSRLDSITLMVEKATFQTNMQGADISEFFPVERDDQLELFMDRTHPEWPSRKSEFYNFLFTVVSDCKKSFGKHLLRALFTRPFMSGKKWPSSG